MSISQDLGNKVAVEWCKVIYDKPDEYVYRLGETVTGRIELFRSAYLSDVDILIECRREVRMVHNDGEGISEIEQKALFYSKRESSYKEKRKSDWYFSVRLPTTFVPGMGEVKSKRKSGQDLTSTEVKALPPTMSFSNRELNPLNTQLSGHFRYSITLMAMKNSWTGFGHTEYESQINCKVIKCTTPLPTPARIKELESQANDIKRDIRIHTLKLLPSYANQTLTMKEKVLTLFNHASIPSIGFSIKVHMPQFAYIGRDLEIILEAEFAQPLVYTKDPTIPPTSVPDVVVETFEFSLKSTTKCTAEKQNYSMKRPETRRDKLIELPMKSSVQKPLVLNCTDREKSQRKVHSFGEIPIDLVPSFMTSHIERSYAADFKAVLSCAGCRRVVKSKSPLLLFSPDDPNSPSRS